MNLDYLRNRILAHKGVTKEGMGVAFYPDGDGETGAPVIAVHETDQIRTLDQLLDAAKVSREDWEVVTFKPNVWHQMSTENGLVPLWQAKAILRRKDLSQTNVRDLVVRGMSALKTALKVALPKKKWVPNGKLCIMGVPDLHLGKLSWAPETGHGHWDCSIAKKVWEEAIDDLLSRAPDCDECWLPLGSDFFNVDNDQDTTTSGTPQDEDGRWQKTFRLGVEMTKWAIGRCRKRFPRVRVMMVYGNHDRQRSFYLGELLAEVAEFVDGVDVDNRPLDRKYYQWGETGIGLAHGDRLKEKDLGALCQNEAREIWGKTKRFELLLGHVHNPIVKTIAGVLTRWLPALCPPDLWHSKSGYVMAEKAATALIYDERAMQVQLMHYPDPKNFE